VAVTPAQIRSDRKKALRGVLKSLRAEDALGEKLERKIRRLLRRNLKILDSEDVADLVNDLRAIDGQLDIVVKNANDLLQTVGSGF
jgi:NADP-dependent 3-hydroxy acid dehydrogenase YdfG